MRKLIGQAVTLSIFEIDTGTVESNELDILLSILAALNQIINY